MQIHCLKTLLYRDFGSLHLLLLTVKVSVSSKMGTELSFSYHANIPTFVTCSRDDTVKDLRYTSGHVYPLVLDVIFEKIIDT